MLRQLGRLARRNAPLRTTRSVATAVNGSHFHARHTLRTPGVMKAGQMPVKVSSADEAVRVIEDGDRIFVHTGAAAPQSLVHAMARRSELRGCEVIHLHTEGAAPYTSPKLTESFFTKCLFIAGNTRPAVRSGRAAYVPIFLSQIPSYFRRSPVDVALITVSPPNKHGYCSLGVSVDCSAAAVEVASTVVAVINEEMPFTHGAGLLHVSEIDYVVDADAKLDRMPVVAPPPTSDVFDRIGKLTAELIEDGSTLQFGIGAVPNAVLRALRGHRDLGIHTELFQDDAMDLIECGAVTNAKKHFMRHRSVSTFALGSARLYEYLDDNPAVHLLDADEVNNPAVIASNDKVVAINSAIEIDLTGQVCADSVGSTPYSGVGGQMDFMSGAAQSHGGKPIIAIPSTTHSGKSKIVPQLQPGAGVVTTRAHLHYVVTEYGVVDVFGMDIFERADALIGIAAPQHRDELQREFQAVFASHMRK